MKKYGFVFPGQGSQSIGMLSDIARDFKEVADAYNQASDVLNYDLWQLVEKGPAELLDQTERTQPALLAGSVALWNILAAHSDLSPVLLAGHSLGEYTALVCAGAISFPDAVRLVALRGQFMQAALPLGEGALAAVVGLDDAMVAEICEKSAQKDEVLTPANFNSPGQVVIAGHKAAVLRALILAKAHGARLAKILPVSVPSHCILMKPAADALQKTLESISILPPARPVVNNVDVKIYQNAHDVRQGLIKQLCLPVRWVETMQFFANEGVTTVIECGPGKILTGLNKRIVPDLALMNTGDLVNLQAVLHTAKSEA